MLEAEAGTAGGVDLDRAADAERVRIGAGRARRLRGLRGSSRGGGSRRSGSGGAAAAGPLAGGVCDQAAPDISSEIVLATMRPAAIRILVFLKVFPVPSRRVSALASTHPARFDSTLVGPAPPRQRPLKTQ